MTSRTIKWVLCLGLLGSLGPPLTADDLASVQFVEAYAGPHPAEFHDLMEQAKVVVPAALAYITGQWGLPNTLHYPLIVRVVEASSKIPGRPIAAYVRSFRSGDELRQELGIDLEHHLLYPGEKLDDILYHEMAHAVLQDAVTSPNATGIPQWFNEGLAQSVTTEGHDRTLEDFKRYGRTDVQAVLCDLNGNIDEFYHGEYNFGCYTQFYLAVRRLIERGGPDTLAKVIAGLRNGTSLPQLVGQVTPLNWPAFQRDVEQYTRDIFAGNVSVP